MLSQVVIPLRLRDMYLTIDEKPIYNYTGPFNYIIEEEDIEEIITVPSQEVDKFFMLGSDIIPFIANAKGICDSTITIVVPDLADLYWRYRHSLSEVEQRMLSFAVKQPLPVFQDIRELPQYTDIQSKVTLYKCIGYLTPYNVLHISVRDFVNVVNLRQKLNFLLDGTNVVVSLDYQEYDFWDKNSNSLIRSVSCS